jgi:predicted DNA-binding transcriptional regulator YafY
MLLFEVHASLKAAIEGRQVLRMRYDDGEERVVEPYYVGETRSGQTMLRAWQRGGYSVSGERQGWKTFRVPEIMELEPNGEVFDGAREGYNPHGDRFIAHFYAMVPPTYPALDWWPLAG